MTFRQSFKKLFSLIDIFLNLKIIPILLFGIFLFYHLFRIPLGLTRVDAGYFLSISRDLFLDSLIPLKDIHSAYTPIAYWIYAIPFALFKNPSIKHFYFYNLFLVLICTLLIYFPVKNFQLRYKLWILLVFFVIISPLIYDIKLELPVLIFSSVSFLFISIYFEKCKIINIFYSSIFIGLAALTKQYALLLLPLTFIFILAILYAQAGNIKKTILPILVVFSIGLFIVFGSYYFIYIGFFKVEPKYLIGQFLGKIKYNCIGDYGERIISKIPLGLKYYLKFLPYSLAIPFLLIFKKSGSEKNQILLFIVLMAMSLIPFYFQIFPHYFYFGLIPVFFLGLIIMEKIKYYTILYVLFLSPILLNSYSVFVLKRDYIILKSRKETDINFYSQISNIVSPGVSAFVEGKRQIYFECGLKSISSKNISYAFLPSSCINNLISDSNVKLDSFFYVGPNQNLTFDEYQKEFLFVTEPKEGYEPHYIFSFTKLICR